jgi:ABC-type sugar transport system substrate-binding protein
MWRDARRITVVLGCLAFVVPGCNSGSFLPPPPPELDAALAPREQRPVTIVSVIFAGPDKEYRRLIAHQAMQEMGRAKASIRCEYLQPGDPAEVQAQAIRDAINRNSAAIVVEPVDSPKVVQALSAARDKRVKVVLLDGTVTTPSDGKPFPRVTFGSFKKAGRDIVQGARKEAARLKLDPKSPALLLIRAERDAHSSDRVESLKNALKDAEIPLDGTLEFGADIDEAKNQLKAMLSKHRVGYVLADEDHGMDIAYEVLAEQHKEGKPTYLTAGYISYDSGLNHFAVNNCAALVDRNLLGLSRKAIETAIALTKGKSVPETIEVPLPFIEAGPSKTYMIGPPGEAPQGKPDDKPKS